MSSEIPNIGSVVRVTTRYPDSYLYAKEEYQYHTHEGTVIPAPFSSAHQTFCITGDSTTKLRVIALSNVFKLEYLTGSGTAAGNSIKARIFKVKSISKNRTYNVVFNNGSYMCDCIGFQYRKSCRHMKAVQYVVKNKVA